MQCPECGRQKSVTTTHTRKVDKDSEQYVRRRKRCAFCDFVFWTREVHELSGPDQAALLAGRDDE